MGFVFALHNHGATDRGWGNHGRRGGESTPRCLPTETLRLKRDASEGDAIHQRIGAVVSALGS
jgi:hypothetical protein